MIIRTHHDHSGGAGNLYGSDHHHHGHHHLNHRDDHHYPVHDHHHDDHHDDAGKLGSCDHHSRCEQCRVRGGQTHLEKQK